MIIIRSKTQIVWLFFISFKKKKTKWFIIQESQGFHAYNIRNASVSCNLLLFLNSFTTSTLNINNTDFFCYIWKSFLYLMRMILLTSTTKTLSFYRNVSCCQLNENVEQFFVSPYFCRMLDLYLGDDIISIQNLIYFTHKILYAHIFHILFLKKIYVYIWVVWIHIPFFF